MINSFYLSKIWTKITESSGTDLGFNLRKKKHKSLNVQSSEHFLVGFNVDLIENMGKYRESNKEPRIISEVICSLVFL